MLAFYSDSDNILAYLGPLTNECRIKTFCIPPVLETTILLTNI